MIELVNFLDTSFEQQMKTRTWRNSEQVSKYFQIQYISEDTHKHWLEKLTEVPHKTIAFFIKKDNDFLGVTYFHSIDYSKAECDWGIYIYNSKYRGQGLGLQTLNKCLDFAKETLNMDTVFLDVLEDNVAAKKLYEKCNFKFSSIKNNVLRYERVL